MNPAENVEGSFQDPAIGGLSRQTKAFLLASALAGLYFISRVNYLLFHTLAEFSGIVIALTVFLLTWNLRRQIRNNFLLIMGISFLFIGSIDLVHTLSYKGMPALFGPGAEATKLWIAARYTQAFALLVALYFLDRPKRIGPAVCLAGFAAWSALLLSSILWWNVFPACFLEGTGLTPFKKFSEYVICAVFGVCALLLFAKRGAFEETVFRMILMSIGFFIASEAAFTLYEDVYGESNLVGHFFKIFGFLAIYGALIRTGLKQPFDLIFRDMKRAEERLVQEHEFNRCLLENMADGVVACDAGGALTLFNRSAREWHGLDPMRLPPGDWARHYDLFRYDGVTPLPAEEIPLAMAYEGKAVRNAGMAIIAKGQAPRFILANGGAITDAGGRKLGAVAVMRDVTDFLRLERELIEANESLEKRVAERTEQLRTSEENYRELIRKIHIAIIVHGTGSRILVANEEARRLLGLTEARPSGEPVADPGLCFLREDGSVMPREEYPAHRALATGEPLRDVVLGVRRTGSEIVVWVLASADPVRGRQGDVSHVIATFVDITGRKRAEDAVTLREREYHTLLDNMPDLIVRYDKELRRTYVNQSWEKASGLSRQEVVNVPTHAIARVPDPIVSEYEQKLRRVLEKGTTENCSFSWVNAFGKELFLEYAIVPEHDRSGGIIGALAIGRDISERRRSEEEMRRLNRELRAISLCNQVLVRAEEEQALLNDICRIVCDDAGYRMAWVGYAENDEAKTVRPAAWYGVEEGYLYFARITWSETERGRGPAGRAIRSGLNQCTKDFLTDPQVAPWREEALLRGYRSSIAMPLKDFDGNVFGAFMIYSAEPDAFTPEEIRLLTELSEDMAFGIATLRTRAERAHDGAVNASRLHLLQFAATHSLDELLEETLNEAESLSGSLIGFYHFVEEDQQSLTLQNWSTRTKAEFCTAKGKNLHYAIGEAGVWVDCVHQRRPVIHNDYASLPHRKGMPEGHAPVLRELVVPVIRGSRIKAILGVGNKPVIYGERDVKAISLLADLA
ncbi:MAG: MASE3 domain-containing protein [Thermodesulfobacteriota bacterium]